MWRMSRVYRWDKHFKKYQMLKMTPINIFHLLCKEKVLYTNDKLFLEVVRKYYFRFGYSLSGGNSLRKEYKYSLYVEQAYFF